MIGRRPPDKEEVRPMHNFVSVQINGSTRFNCTDSLSIQHLSIQHCPQTKDGSEKEDLRSRHSMHSLPIICYLQHQQKPTLVNELLEKEEIPAHKRAAVIDDMVLLCYIAYG